MSSNAELDAQFSAIMSANRNRIATRRPVSVISRSGRGAESGRSTTAYRDQPQLSRPHPRNEEAPPQPSIQAKYDTVVKGFKALEIIYEESQKKLAAAEERLSAVDTAHTALIAEMEVGRKVLHGRNTEIDALRQTIETNKAALYAYEAEIGMLRENTEKDKVFLRGCEAEIETIRKELACRDQFIANVRAEVEGLLTCGICHCTAVQAYSIDCRHTYCATCIFDWWSSSRGTTCPTCRTVCENIPVRDRSNGLISLLSQDPNESIAPFDAENFVVLMAQIKEDTIQRQEQAAAEAAEEAAAEAALSMVIGYPALDGSGSAVNPLDLTGDWL